MRLSLTRFSLVALSLVLIGGCASHTPTAKPAPVVIKLIAFNDFHGNINPPGSPTHVADPNDPSKILDVPTGGAAYLATLIEKLKARNPRNAVVAAGDLIGGAPLASSLFHHESTVEVLSEAGVEFSSVGNHEFDAGRDELLRMQNGGCVAQPPHSSCVRGDFKGARFKYLAANVIDDRTGKPLFAPYAIKEFTASDGTVIPVAFIGLVLKDAASLVVASGVAGLTFKDEADSANALLPELRARGVQAIVILIHEGGFISARAFDDATCPDFTGAIKQIADRLDPAIDVIVSGHTHRTYICRYNGRLITSAGSEGRYLTDIDLTIDPATKDVIAAKAQMLAVVNDLLPNPLPAIYPTLSKEPRVAALVDFYNQQAAPLSQREVGKISADLTRSASVTGESSLGDFVADAQLAATASAGAQIAFMNRGGMRSDLRAEKGVVTYNDVFSIHPFGNSLMTLTLTGAQIHAMLEIQWDRGDTMLSVSNGFSYTWDGSKPVGQRVDEQSMKLNGVTMRADQTYRVTVNSFLAEGGSGFTLLKNAPDRVRGTTDVDALEQYVATHSPVVAPPSGRIFRKN